MFHSWPPKVYHPDPRDKTKIRLKIVGQGVTLDDDPIVFNGPTNSANSESTAGGPAEP